MIIYSRWLSAMVMVMAGIQRKMA